ncbi:MAG: hypothetical protein QOJ64_2868 [Acidobacteriota bacterium]|nr:hypothetical protein [Acidobacteriota bacterium]
MRDKAQQIVPCARKARLVVQELPDEVLVYDLDRHKAHCLNKASALVWKHCDGKSTVGQLRALLEEALGTATDDDVVWLALGQLRRFHLLEEESKGFGMMKVTRRDLVSKYLPAALALPLILSIPSPAAAQAASCRPPGSACTANAQCCGPGGVGVGFCSAGVCFTNPP